MQTILRVLCLAIIVLSIQSGCQKETPKHASSQSVTKIKAYIETLPKSLENATAKKPAN